jgi:hypothetical protein
MFSRIAVIAALTAALACAGCAGDDPNVKRVEVEVVKKSAAVVQASRSSSRPEPVYSTSFAIRLAELALKESGVQDCERRNVAVSYLEGIYTVVFERPESHINTADYRVCIEAETSRIVLVDTGR